MTIDLSLFVSLVVFVFMGGFFIGILMEHSAKGAGYNSPPKSPRPKPPPRSPDALYTPTSPNDENPIMAIISVKGEPDRPVLRGWLWPPKQPQRTKDPFEFREPALLRLQDVRVLDREWWGNWRVMHPADCKRDLVLDTEMRRWDVTAAFLYQYTEYNDVVLRMILAADTCVEVGA